MMKRITLPTEKPIAAMLAQPDQASDRLLVCVRRDHSEAGCTAFVSESWNVLDVGTADADAASAARGIVDALKLTKSHLDCSTTMFVADRGIASAACRAVLHTHQNGMLPGRSGLVTIDAFAEPDMATRCEELAPLEHLATIWTVSRSNSALRKTTFAHHNALQARNRETHFLVLSERTKSLVERLSDSSDPLGREARWLLEPIHSRSA